MEHQPEKRLQIQTRFDDFRSLSWGSDLYVDKSLFVKEIIDNQEGAIMITRPRRWGKSTNLDMLKIFFQPEHKPECEALRGTNITLEKRPKDFSDVPCNRHFF